MNYYRLRLAYVGTRYKGWQLQAEEVTVAGVLVAAFQEAFGVPVTVVGASRTDAGVHSYDQVVRCATMLALDTERMRIVWNRALPHDMTIRVLEAVDERFHPQYGVQYKTYWYHLFEARPLPFWAPYGWELFYPLDISKLQSSLRMVVGTHDFRSFCTGTEYESTECHIDAIEITYIKHWQAWRIAVHGPRFLYRMVRRIVGSAVYIATRPALSTALYREVFEARDPYHALMTAPAQGLMLRKIVYTK